MEALKGCFYLRWAALLGIFLCFFTGHTTSVSAIVCSANSHAGVTLLLSHGDQSSLNAASGKPDSNSISGIFESKEESEAPDCDNLLSVTGTGPINMPVFLFIPCNSALNYQVLERTISYEKLYIYNGNLLL